MDPWTGSLLALVLLLVALELVSVLLALEHRVGKPAPEGERTPLPGVPVGMAVIWGMRSLVTLAVVLAVYVAWGGEFWSVTWAVPPVAELVAFGLLVWAWRTQRQPPPLEPIAPSGFADDAPAQDEGTPERPSTRLFAIGASGGGIRAAAFVLGGHQAVQESSAELDCATAANEPHVFAVSGGRLTSGPRLHCAAGTTSAADCGPTTPRAPPGGRRTRWTRRRSSGCAGTRGTSSSRPGARGTGSSRW